MVKYDDIIEHVAVLADACRHRNRQLRGVVAEWAASLRRVDIPLSLIPQLSDYATVQTLTTWYGAGWWIFDRRDVSVGAG